MLETCQRDVFLHEWYTYFNRFPGRQRGHSKIWQPSLRVWVFERCVTYYCMKIILVCKSMNVYSRYLACFRLLVLQFGSNTCHYLTMLLLPFSVGILHYICRYTERSVKQLSATRRKSFFFSLANVIE